VLLAQGSLPQHHRVRVGDRRKSVVQDYLVERHGFEFTVGTQKGAATIIRHGTRLVRFAYSGV